jgi:hypothetical protein
MPTAPHQPLDSTDQELLKRAAGFFEILQEEMVVSTSMYIRLNRWLMEFNRNRGIK